MILLGTNPMNQSLSSPEAHLEREHWKKHVELKDLYYGDFISK